MALSWVEEHEREQPPSPSRSSLAAVLPDPVLRSAGLLPGQGFTGA